MGVMIAGVYHADDPGPDTTEGGAYRRAASSIRCEIPARGDIEDEPGRYHLYAAWNCPWAHRALLARVFCGLTDAIPVSYACPRRTEHGWVFDADGAFADPLLAVTALHEVYARQDPPYTGRITVPVLWDKSQGRIVSNESADIVRLFNAMGTGPDLYPDALRSEIDAWNDRIYPGLNNGVYRAGFARTQAAYEDGCRDVFETLDAVEERLQGADWLAGDTFTEADLRLFPTLARFDVAYHFAFKCNLHRIVDYPAIWAYARRIYAMPGVAGTVDFDIYKRGYFSPSELRNPLGIVPLGPVIDWSL